MSETNLQEQIDMMIEALGADSYNIPNPNNQVNQESEAEKVCTCDRLLYGHLPGCPFFKEL